MYTASVAPSTGLNYLGQGVHQPSGLVVGYTSEDSQQQRTVHGLGMMTTSATLPLESGVGIGLYQGGEGYGNQDHSQLYRRQQSIPPLNPPSSLTASNTGFALAPSPQPPHPTSQSQGDRLYRRAGNEGHQFGQTEETDQLPGNGTAGWWSGGASDRSRAAWPEHNMVKKEYSHG